MPPKMTDDQLRWALKQAALRNAQQRRLGDVAGVEGPAGLLLPRAQPSPEHYHLVYNVPKDEISVPNFSKVYITSKEAYQEVFDLGMRAQPNAEFYENGTVGMETRLHGRADLWWIVVEVAACIKTQCLSTVAREQQKRRLVIVPEPD